VTEFLGGGGWLHSLLAACPGGWKALHRSLLAGSNHHNSVCEHGVGSLIYSYTVNRFLRVSSKFGTCTVVRVYGTLVEDKMRKFKGECAHFSFSKCPIYTHDGASANFSTNSHERDNSVYLNL
jgi:hypothetical protein